MVSSGMWNGWCDDKGKKMGKKVQNVALLGEMTLCGFGATVRSTTHPSWWPILPDYQWLMQAYLFPLFNPKVFNWVLLLLLFVRFSRRRLIKAWRLGKRESGDVWMREWKVKMTAKTWSEVRPAVNKVVVYRHVRSLSVLDVIPYPHAAILVFQSGPTSRAHVVRATFCKSKGNTLNL